MPEPGVILTSKAARAARGEPTDTGVGFMTGLTQRGPVDRAVHVTSLDELTRHFGDRVAYGQVYDAADFAFSEGLADLYVARIVGPAAAEAFSVLQDRAGAPVNTLRLEAVDPGDWANGATGGLSREVQDGTLADTFRLIIRLNGEIVETHDNLTMGAADERYAPTILEGSSYVRGIDQNSATAAPDDQPAVSADADLAGGTDDRASVVEAHWTAALDLFPKDLGPGQVAAPGHSTAAGQQALIDHAEAMNRAAVLDVADKANRATLLAAAAALDDYDSSEDALLAGSWFDIPGVIKDTTRAVPGSAAWMGKIAERDAIAGTAGFAPAGNQGTLTYAVAVRKPDEGFSEADYTDLNNAGVAMAQEFRNRGVQLYGFRSVTSNPDWQQFSSHRLRMSLVARLNDIALKYVFRTIDGQGFLFSELGGELAAECQKDYQRGALFGASKNEAYRVDVGPTVNTPETIAAGEIRAKVFARFSPFAEVVRIDIVKVPVTGQV